MTRNRYALAFNLAGWAVFFSPLPSWTAVMFFLTGLYFTLTDDE